MKHSSRVIAIVLLLAITITALIVFTHSLFTDSKISDDASLSTDRTPIGELLQETLTSVKPTPTATPLPMIPNEKVLPSEYHVFQTFNNCGPAALSMTLAYYNISASQQVLGDKLRPFQNPQGDNDDKSVTLEELATLAEKEYGLVAFHRPIGDMAVIEQLIANDLPVITRTLLNENDDIGHFRVIKGYNKSKQTVIQDDSLQGKNLEYTYQSFNVLWQPFNYEYLVLVPIEKVGIVSTILAENADEKTAWINAVEAATNQLKTNPNDVYAQLNLSVAQYMVGNYQASIDAFEKVQARLPMRTLWYQIEPIEAYYAAGDYEKVFALTDQILNNHNRAFTELYILRGKIYLTQQNIAAAKSEFEKAVYYNVNNSEARELMNSI